MMLQTAGPLTGSKSRARGEPLKWGKSAGSAATVPK